MAHHVSTRTIESKAFPGVRFVLRKMTKRRADTLEEMQAPYAERLRPLYEEFTPLDTERVEAKGAFPDDKLKRWAELLGQIRKIDERDMAPIAVRAVLSRIDDLDITYNDPGGVEKTEPATLDLVMEYGPDELYGEILHEVKRECGLLPEEIKNSEPLSISAAVEGGSPGNADHAETLVTITPADA